MGARGHPAGAQPPRPVPAASPTTSSRCCRTSRPTAPSPSCSRRMAQGKAPRSWRPWRAGSPAPRDSPVPLLAPNKTLGSAPLTPGVRAGGRGGTAHGRAEPHVAIYIEFIYIHVRQTPRPRHRYVHKAKCKYLNALNTELKKRSLHNTARGPGPPSPGRRQHDGTARTTHNPAPARTPAPRRARHPRPRPRAALPAGTGREPWGSGAQGPAGAPSCPTVPGRGAGASPWLSTRPRTRRRGHRPACPPRPRRRPAARGCRWGSAAPPTG